MNWPFGRRQTLLDSDLGKKLDRFLDAARSASGGHWQVDFKSIAGAEEFLQGGECGAAVLLELAEGLARKCRRRSQHMYGVYDPCVDQLIGAINRRKPAFSRQQVAHLIELYREAGGWFGTLFGPKQLSTYAVAAVERQGLTAEWKALLQSLIRELDRRRMDYAEDRRALQRLRNLLSGLSPSTLALTEGWQKPFGSEALLPVAVHASNSRGNKPSKKWSEGADFVLGGADLDSICDAFEAVIVSLRARGTPVNAEHSDMLRGLCWMMGLTQHPRSAFLLGQMLLACGHKLSGFGARSQKGFSGCVEALSRMGTTEALAELSRARSKIKTPSLAELLFVTLTRAAKAQGLPMAELEELVVPDFRLQALGTKTIEFGNVVAELSITGTAKVEIEWRKDGKVLKSKPKLSEEDKGEAASLIRLKKMIESALAGQKQRIESLYFIERSWKLDVWRARYVDHPLLANISRRLIWRFETARETTLGIAPAGEIIDCEAHRLNLTEQTAVQLWHPIDSDRATVEKWREFLFTHEISQPFKQAHREIYVLTDAEQQTDTYSNRFAAHVLRQHQMAALMRQRGWKYALMGGFDFHNTPTLNLPTIELRAQFWVDVPPFVWEQGEFMTESGTGMYVTTDQVCFLNASEERVSLADVPAKIFSEVLRDVDLFVGVAGVANDPNWRDQGARIGYGAYWQSVSFGDLSASAETRKTILARLLPRLSISDVASIDGKFLVVKGRLRTYKIHLGSANILMKPNDQYLCIVPNARSLEDHKVFLPFEGDSTMSIILSKALMLANDMEIRDETITRQIKR